MPHAFDAALLDRVAHEMTTLRESDPEAWADYLEEGQRWEDGTVDRVDP
ncbi:MAG: hypothetical protein ACRD29_19050 [Acidimicrobiales bacterium]